MLLSGSDPAHRIGALREELARRGLDAFIVPRYDAHQGEYIAPHDERLRHVTGFSGSAGLAIVTRDDVAVFVDGRYTVQVALECPPPLFSHHHLLNEPPEVWLRDTVGQGAKVGYDPMLLPPVWFDRFRTACDAVGCRLLAVSDNPVDAVWLDQPPPPMGRITPVPLAIAGRSPDDKRADLLVAIGTAGVDLLVETQPDNIAWLLNLRGADVAFNPVPLSFLLIRKEGQATWFVDPGKLDADMRQILPGWVAIRPVAAFPGDLSEMVAPGVRVLIDPAFSPVAVRHRIEDRGGQVHSAPGPLTLAKASKNPTELDGFRACHLQDGIAWAEFGAWLADAVPSRAHDDPVTESEAEAKIQACRRDRPGYLGESFNPISAAAGNAAMCHYATTPTRNSPILPGNPYLLDSGGQYVTGTTDATRSYAFGLRPDGYDRAYTAVFKAFHALATLRFPPGTQGHHIDAICRRPLWDLGLDYDHGTGHGIGHRLSVHEHPQRIGKPVNAVDLKPGMIITVEPGYYDADRFGIRIENVFEIAQGPNGFMEFRNLTLIPIQTDMLLPDLLSSAELSWLDAYHRDVAARLAPHLSATARVWLDRATRPLAP